VAWRAALGGLLVAVGCGRSPLLVADGSGGGDWGSGRDDDDDDGEGDGGNGVQQCREIDFLFLIDNSASMAMYQNNVVSNYEVFIDGIEEAIETIERMHIGVVTAVPYDPNAHDCRQLGGLVVETGGPSASGQECGPYRDGYNFMTTRDDLDFAFRCAAQVGTGGTDLDAPLAAIAAAVSPPLTNEGECNEGFVGDGALLVLVIVSDTYPNAFGQMDLDPYFAAEAIVGAIGGFDDVVVVLFASTSETPCLNPLASGLETFADLFDHSFKGAICDHSYLAAFTEAIEVVKAACPAPK
jgi:hypothetical protein